MTCHGIRSNVRHIGILHLVSILTITAIDMSLCTSLRNFIQIGPRSAEKKTSCRFSRWRMSAILDFTGPTMGSLKSPCTTSYRSSIMTIALKCLVCEKIAILQFGDRQTNRQTIIQTDEQMDTPVLHEAALAVANGCLIKKFHWNLMLCLSVLIETIV